MPQVSREREYYNKAVNYLLEQVYLTSKQFETQEEYFDKHNITDPEYAIAEVPKIKLSTLANINYGTANHYGLWWQIENQIAGVENVHYRGKLRIHIPTFVEEELGGWGEHNELPLLKDHKKGGKDRLNTEKKNEEAAPRNEE